MNRIWKKFVLSILFPRWIKCQRDETENRIQSAALLNFLLSTDHEPFLNNNCSGNPMLNARLVLLLHQVFERAFAVQEQLQLYLLLFQVSPKAQATRLRHSYADEYMRQ